MTTRVSSTNQDRVLRALPSWESGDSVRAHEVASALGISSDMVHRTLAIATKRGLATRRRPGDWAKAPKAVAT